MMVSVDSEKEFYSIQHSFIIKILNKTRVVGIFLNIVKVINHKPQTTILYGEKLQAFIPLILGLRFSWLFLSLLLFNILLEVLCNNHEGKIYQGDLDGKIEIKFH